MKIPGLRRPDFKPASCARHVLRISVMALVCVPVNAQNYYSPGIRDFQTGRAFQKLLHANIFNLGGVGWANEITTEEKAFVILFSSPDSIKLFQRLLTQANPEGQLYALFGLHLQAPATFKLEAERLKADDGPPERLEKFVGIGRGEVRVARGCIFFRKARKALIDQIANGEWDTAFRPSTRKIERLWLASNDFPID
jgi:hypothetical protein